MFRRINFFSICFAFGISILLILAGSRYTDNVNYHPKPEGRRILRNYEDGDDFLQTVSMDLEDSLNNDKILYDTLLKNKIELNDYNFTFSGAHSLKDLMIDSGGKPLRSLIVSTWRSGTTFLGEILNAMPGNFYHYEPLLKYEIIQIRGPPLADEVMSQISNFLKCDFMGADDYFEYGKTHLYQFSHNTRLWDHCKYKKELCSDAEFTGKFCKLFPFQSMKVVRIRLHLVQQLFKDKDLNVKVILLIRDPRAVLQSRQHRDFCQPSPDCWQPELLCADMISDYVAAMRLMKEYPDRLMVLRYEELALDPYSSVNQIFKFLSLASMPQVEQFLHSHTNVEAGGVSSTFRVSKEVPFRWRHALDFGFVDEIQIACKEAMDLWGYAIAQNSTHMTSDDFNPLLPYSV